MQMMDFGDGPGGPMISGKWINKRTGQVINIRDSFMDDSNNMIINSDKGQLSMDDFSKYYIQASDEVYDQSGNVVETKPIDNQELGIEGGVVLSNNSQPVEADSIYGGAAVSEKPALKNFDLIDKIFKKTDSKPEIELKIKWDNFPNKELSMLVNIFDVKTEEIAQYINKCLVNSDLLNESLDKWLKENLI